MHTHTCARAHTHRGSAAAAADALRSLTRAGLAAERRTAEKHALAMTSHSLSDTHTHRRSSSFCCHIFCTFLFRSSISPFYHFFSSFVHSSFVSFRFVSFRIIFLSPSTHFMLLNRCHLVLQHLHLAALRRCRRRRTSESKQKVLQCCKMFARQQYTSRLSIAAAAINCVDYKNN